MSRPDVQRSYHTLILWHHGHESGKMSRLSSCFYKGKEQLEKWFWREMFSVVNNLLLKGATMK